MKDASLVALPMLQSGCVLLLDTDPDRISYLHNIFEFLDYRLIPLNSAEELETELKRQQEFGCVSVMMSSELDSALCEQAIQKVHDAKGRPALLHLLSREEEENIPDEKNGSQFLGVLKLRSGR